MIRDRDVDRINVIAHFIEHFAIISEHRLAWPGAGDVLKVVSIDVAIGDHIHLVMGSDAFDVAPTLIVTADTGKIEGGIGGFRFGDIRHDERGGLFGIITMDEII